MPVFVRAFITLICFACSIVMADVQGTRPVPDQPREYVVQPGDTLWDIAERLLHDPWQWKALWERNRSLAGPDRIYPGDTIVLVEVAGQPALRVQRSGRPVIRLTPNARTEDLSAAIAPAPTGALEKLFDASRVVAAETLDQAPYVVAAEGGHMILGFQGDRAYVRGLSPGGGTRFALYRPAGSHVDPATGETLGHGARFLGKGIVERYGDPATIRLIEVEREIVEGDILLPPEPGLDSSAVLPHPVESPVEGRIISVLDGVAQVGRYSIVGLNLGEVDGLEPGHVLAVFRAGATVEDPRARHHPRPQPFDPTDWLLADDGQAMSDALPKAEPRRALPVTKTVTLPDESAGLVMVFRTFERMSYALVMRAKEVLSVNDLVGQPVPGS